MRHITALQSKRLQSIACSDMEDIRLDEESVSKTVASRRVRVRVPGLPLRLKLVVLWSSG